MQTEDRYNAHGTFEGDRRYNTDRWVYNYKQTLNESIQKYTLIKILLSKFNFNCTFHNMMFAKHIFGIDNAILDCLHRCSI